MYVNGPWVYMKINDMCFTPMGKQKADKCRIPEGYMKKDVNYLTVLLDFSGTGQTIFITEYYVFYAEDGKFYLHFDDRAHPEITYAVTFRITPKMFTELLNYTYQHANVIKVGKNE